MLTVDNMVGPSPQQMSFIIQGMRNPKNSWDKSDSYFLVERDDHDYDYEYEYDYDYDYDLLLGQKDLDLMRRLIKAGPEHRKFLRQMWLGLRITAPLYWWKEFDTYKIGTTSNSCSTMHTLMDRPFSVDMFSTEMLNGAALNQFTDLVRTLEVLRQIYKRGDTFDGHYYEPRSKDVWYMIIQMLPSSFNQTRNVSMNYETVLSILNQRAGHKLHNEWLTLCEKLSYEIPYLGNLSNLD